MKEKERTRRRNREGGNEDEKENIAVGEKRYMTVTYKYILLLKWKTLSEFQTYKLQLVSPNNVPE